MSQNIFDKYYLGGSHSKETPKSSNQKNSSNEVVTTATFVNYNLSNEFANMFTYYIVPYLSISDVINLKLCNKTLNILVGHKAIKFAIIANAAKGKFSEEKRFKLWKHYLQLKFFKGDLYESYSDFKPKNKKKKKRELFYKFILNQGEKIKKGEKVYIVQENGEDVKIKDWIKVRTEDGVIGYLKEKNLINKKTIRDDLKYGGIEGKVSLVWDYYTQYNSAPNRTEKIDGINAVSPSYK